ncbi:MAG: dihydropteroate synthase [Candidatus Margulisbacteria bacterium]|nr:dihydropteroate synthase [Candidatus Margulisiibacteriota bacterium]MBU1022438.1 dihydropteroate synthase [Candidatus Margulisiibacteriota bacterium]MBU1728422.1 dihydropteroate synthase [Candidatus Margulisiibacteriota bacterium]MBU1954569.1 dihydropteroate synthase [Candidatus Margulisiibacteriota bacterium]
MKKIGVDPRGIKVMEDKSRFFAVKLLGVGTVAANILKQEMLSRGGEVAVSYGSVNLSAKTTDVLVFGTRRAFNQLAAKLKMHQFGLPQIASETLAAIKNYSKRPAPLKIGKKKFNFKRTYIMGILNVTPDSFSDGGDYLNVDAAVERAVDMETEGADIIDIGGESTRPGSNPVSADAEITRVVPVIKKLKKRLAIPVSIDTYKSKVAKAALAAGAAMVNDISGLRFDKKMAKVLAKAKVPVCVMHIKGKPRNMQKKIVYADLVSEIYCYLKESIEIAKRAGILDEQIVIDPGLGFGKTVDFNFEILKRLAEFKSLGHAILVGPSRKSFIGAVLNLPPAERREGTAAAVVAAISGGANIVRVHDISSIKRVALVADKIYNEGRA